MTDLERVDSQSDFFSQNRRLHSQHPEFNDICNALYERELRYLAHEPLRDIRRLQQRLGGLSHHVRNIAYFMAANPTPLVLDTYNASWFAKQPKQPPTATADAALPAFLTRYAGPGLVLPVRTSIMNLVQVELDSIDRVSPSEQRVHMNKHGWFSYSGEAIEPARTSGHDSMLLRPTKASMTAACCGHQWKANGRADPRVLTLRELLLVTTIDWNGFKRPVTPMLGQV